MSDHAVETGGVAVAGAAAPRAPARRRARWRAVALASLVPWLVVVGLWELVYAEGWVTTVMFPPPSRFIAYAIENNFRVGFGRDAMTLPFAILASAYRVLVGLLIGFAAALAAGIAIAKSRVAALAILPLVRGLAPIAPIAWIPMGILIFGIGNGTAIFVVFTGIFFLLTINTVAAVHAVDPRLIKTARTFGASPRQVWLWVIFPAILPSVFIMLRMNFFAAWMAVLAAEMVGLKNGLGMIVMLGREMFNPSLILLGICLVGLTGYLVDALLVLIERKVLWWRPEARA
jgi:NitT/TauT family transport system permease protein